MAVTAKLRGVDKCGRDAGEERADLALCRAKDDGRNRVAANPMARKRESRDKDLSCRSARG
jgi:hypothetical protein